MPTDAFEELEKMRIEKDNEPAVDTTDITVLVYGSLLRGLHNSHFLSSATLLLPHARTQSSEFLLIDSGGGYPYACHAADSPSSGYTRTAIVGELVRVSERTLASLDLIEGHPDHYKRELTPIKGWPTPAWVYVLAKPKTLAAIRTGTEAYREVAPPGDWRSYHAAQYAEGAGYGAHAGALPGRLVGGYSQQSAPHSQAGFAGFSQFGHGYGGHRALSHHSAAQYTNAGFGGPVHGGFGGYVAGPSYGGGDHGDFTNAFVSTHETNVAENFPGAFGAGPATGQGQIVAAHGGAYGGIPAGLVGGAAGYGAPQVADHGFAGGYEGQVVDQHQGYPTGAGRVVQGHGGYAQAAGYGGPALSGFAGHGGAAQEAYGAGVAGYSGYGAAGHMGNIEGAVDGSRDPFPGYGPTGGTVAGAQHGGFAGAIPAGAAGAAGAASAAGYGPPGYAPQQLEPQAPLEDQLAPQMSRSQLPGPDQMMPDQQQAMFAPEQMESSSFMGYPGSKRTEVPKVKKETSAKKPKA